MKIGDKVAFVGYDSQGIITQIDKIVETPIFWVKWNDEELELPYQAKWLKVLSKDHNHPSTNIFK